MGPAPHRARENVKDFAALPTTIFRHRGALAFVRGLALGPSVSGRTAQSVGMQSTLKIMVTLLFIKQLGDRKLHHAEASPPLKIWLLLVPILHPATLFQLDADMSVVVLQRVVPPLSPQP